MQPEWTLEDWQAFHKEAVEFRRGKVKEVIERYDSRHEQDVKDDLWLLEAWGEMFEDNHLKKIVKKLKGLIKKDGKRKIKGIEAGN